MGCIYVFTDCDGECAALASYNANQCAKQALKTKLMAAGANDRCDRCDRCVACAGYRCPEYCDDAGTVHAGTVDAGALRKTLAGIKLQTDAMKTEYETSHQLATN